jgi:hypothetical protein
MHPLDGPRRKLDRAAEHIQTFWDAVNSWYDTKPFRIIAQYFNADKTAYIFRIEIPAIPIRFGIIVGDIFYNLRSSLDYLAWQLATFNQDTAMRREGWESDVEFPIFLHRTKWDISKKVKRFLTYIPDDARQIIENLQPYNTPNGSKPENHGLWILYSLSNCDKHRVITLNAGLTEFEMKTGMSQKWFDDTAVEITVPVVQNDLPPPPPNARFYLVLGRDITPPGFQITIIEGLHNLITKTIIPRFERFFP